ncbi:transcription factor hes-1, putative [Ixodes scapularis]|uniref:Transcription factor hes-1, putative n=1 Tax=Ixodes scapularis TaxID=6945 RepID=B7PHP0_IXOSC|nr:transcription factor hes-1, putative [Ixodes scapularis]|eukprot:XP_002403347.1 transcription factor hes-1, putative [Ixodes scapularis]
MYKKNPQCPYSKRSCLSQASKPLMEKRRRARINHSLSQLKSLLLDTPTKKESQKEEATIPRVLLSKVAQRGQVSRLRVPTVVSAHELEARFQAGFAECAREVTRFVCNTDVDASMRSRLLGHLASCLASLPTPPTAETEDQAASSGTVIVKAEPGSCDSSVSAVPSPSCAQDQCMDPLACRPASPLNLATSARSVSSTSSASSGISMPASPYSDSESTTSASEDNYGDVVRMDVQTFGVIRRAPAMYCDPVWRPW